MALRSHLTFSPLFLTALLCLSQAQAQQPVHIEGEELYQHRTGSPAVLHVDAATTSVPLEEIRLKVVVNEWGVVDSAQATFGPPELFAAAEDLQSRRKYEPFLRDGAPVWATFEDSILLVPPEQWKDPLLPFPKLQSLDSLLMQHKHTRCYGGCPVYEVAVSGNGTVTYKGKLFVLVPGEHQAHISPVSVQALLNEFRKANFFSLKDNYSALITDNPAQVLSISFDANKKSVTDYVGLRVGLPVAVSSLEEAFDRIAGTEKWVKGNTQIGPALVAEHWNFKADTEENRTLFANAIEHGQDDLVRLFVAQGGPALGLTSDGHGPLLSAAGKGDLPLVRTLLGMGAKPSAAVLSCTFGAAAQSGNLALVRFLYDRHADVNGPPCGPHERNTVLMNAVASHHPEIVLEVLTFHPDVNARDANGFSALVTLLQDSGPSPTQTESILNLLLTAGADVNNRDGQGQTPLFYACQNPAVVRALVRAGADLNATNEYGQTALMTCFGAAGLQALIDAGADLTLRNKHGETAAEAARHMGSIENAALLDKAVRARTENPATAPPLN